MNITSGNQPRSFTGFIYSRNWVGEKQPCLYAGDMEAGPVNYVARPDDGVIEGTYKDYETQGAFSERKYKFGLFNEDKC